MYVHVYVIEIYKVFQDQMQQIPVVNVTSGSRCSSEWLTLAVIYDITDKTINAVKWKVEHKVMKSITILLLLKRHTLFCFGFCTRSRSHTFLKQWVPVYILMSGCWYAQNIKRVHILMSGCWYAQNIKWWVHILMSSCWYAQNIEWWLTVQVGLKVTWSPGNFEWTKVLKMTDAIICNRYDPKPVVNTRKEPFFPVMKNYFSDQK